VIESLFAGARLRYTRMSISDVTGTGNQTRGYYRQTMFAPFRPRRVSLSVASPLEQTIADVNRLRPDVVRSYGSFLELLFGTVRARGRELHRPRLVVYGGDVLTPAGRRLIEDDFGIPVVSRYNAVEAFKIGFVCEERRAFHLHDDLCPVRIVDEAGRTVPDGVHGEVVISNLVNRGTVLLNYRLGDVAAIVPGTCGCGRTTRLLSAITGRVSEWIELPGDGALFTPTMLWDALHGFPEIIRYQLVQHEPDRFELQLVAAGEHAFDRVASPAAAAVAALLRGGRVEATYHDPESSPDVGKIMRIRALPRDWSRS
jgi:phenylacetate-CoA ligase